MAATKKPAPESFTPTEAQLDKWREHFRKARERTMQNYQEMIDLSAEQTRHYRDLLKRARRPEHYVRVCVRCDRMRDNSYVGGDYCSHCGTKLIHIPLGAPKGKGKS